MKHYKAVLYDIDGTILNTLDMNMYPLMRIIKEELDEDWSYERVLQFAANPGLRTLETLGVRDIETTYARWVRYVNEYEEGAVLYEGFEEVFPALQNAGILQGIVSSKMKPQYQIDFVSKGLDRYIAAAVLAEDTDAHKPDPTPILECLRRLNVLPEEAIYIGDAPTDLESAGNAGVDFGYAKWGSVFDLAGARPDHIFEKPLDLLKLLPKPPGVCCTSSK